ncbi:hypothetical protein B0H11DRAFT_1924388 [Mycena galericulata]|nr:hypothetical protein B0H11DRAFT_1924388 [Mycena galericulata]
MSSDTNPPLYPFPSLGNYDSEGRHLVSYAELYGNVADLRQRLLNFSSDSDSWAALVPGAVCSHLGPRAGSKTKKKSTLRWEARDRSESSNAARTISAVQKGMNPVVWAAKVCSMVLPAPSQPPSRGISAAPSATVPSNPHAIATAGETSGPLFFNSLALEPTIASSMTDTSLEPVQFSPMPTGYEASAAVPLPSSILAYPQSPHITFQTSSAEHHRSLPLALDSFPQRTDSFAVAPVPSSEYMSVDQGGRPGILQVPKPTPQFASFLPHAHASTSYGHAGSLHSVLGVAISSDNVDTRTIYLKTGPVVLTEAHVPDPPGFNAQLRGPMDKVLKNILRWWDDRRPEWDSECALLKIRINDEKVGVPGILWKELYASPWKANQWVGIKSRYSELLCIMNYYDHLVDEGRTDDFWAPITISDGEGERVIMLYSKAVATLRTRREQMIQEQATELLRDPTFDGCFSYKRGGKVVNMRNASAIVKRARHIRMS